MIDLTLTIQTTSKLPIPVRATLKRWVLAALERRLTKKPTKAAEITLRFVDSREGRALNRDYRHKDYATNVLTFVYEQGERCVGDLIFCMPVVLKEARQQKKNWRAHCAHLVVHGVLHLQGFNHENDHDAEIMEARETAILAHLGYPNPYLCTETE